MNPRDYLFDLERFGIKLGLENIARLLDAAKRPQDRLTTVHVAGTNGKGSVLAFLDAMFRAADYRTARYTSPHLIALNERFLVDGSPISDRELDKEIRFFQTIAKDITPAPTFFEFVTAVAFRFFAKRDVEVALIEVGMGGRFDATNVVRPAVTAITNITLEHTRYLGDTLEKIAFEKAGIVKKGVPLVLGDIEARARTVIIEQARRLEAPVCRLGAHFHFKLEGPTTAQKITYDGIKTHIEAAPLGLSATYQGENAAIALALAELLEAQYPKLNRDAMEKGLKDVRWPCRLERVLDSPPVILDVAHNTAGMRGLAREIEPCVVLLAVSADKDAAGMIDAVAPVARRLILTRFRGKRAMPLDTLTSAAAGREFCRADNLAEGIKMGLQLAEHERVPLLIAGSVFTAGQARELLIERYGAPPLAF